MTTSQTTQPPAIIKIDQSKLIATFKKKGGLVDYCDAIAKRAEELKSEVATDMSVGKNRKALKSIGAQVGKMNARFGEARKLIVDGLKEKIKVVTDEITIVNAESKYASEFFKKLRQEIPAEAFAWEEKEEARKQSIHDGIERIKAYAAQTEGVFADVLLIRLEDLEKYVIDEEQFGEFKEVAQAAKIQTIAALKKDIELAELREAEEKRKADEEKAMIRQQAKEEAEKKLEEEKLAAKIREKEAAETKARLIQERIKEIGNLALCIVESKSTGIKYRLELLHKTKLTEENFGEFIPQAREAYNKAQTTLNGELERTLEREKKEAQERAEREKKEAQERAEREKKEAQERAEREKREEEIRLAEALEQQKEEARQRQEALARDKAHRKKVHSEIKEDILALNLEGIDEVAIGALVYAISQAKIRRLLIQY